MSSLVIDNWAKLHRSYIFIFFKMFLHSIRNKGKQEQDIREKCVQGSYKYNSIINNNFRIFIQVLVWSLLFNTTVNNTLSIHGQQVILQVCFCHLFSCCDSACQLLSIKTQTQTHPSSLRGKVVFLKFCPLILIMKLLTSFLSTKRDD